MKKRMWLVATIFLAGLLYAEALALPAIEGEVFSLIPITNEVSFYQNSDNSWDDRGQTLQVIAINSFKVWTEFVFELTADFNWDLFSADIGEYHYMELSLVKPVVGCISLNYQRIVVSDGKPVNQFGIRLSF